MEQNRRWQTQFAGTLRPGDQVKLGKETEAFILRGPRINPVPLKFQHYDVEYIMYDLVTTSGEHFSRSFGRSERIRVFR
jgi:hypothetical protein